MADPQQQQRLFRFDRDLKAFGKAMVIDHTTVVKKISFDLFARIVAKTPARTGRARASWTIAIDAPDRSVAPPGKSSRSMTGAAPNDAVGRAAATRETARKLKALKPGEFRDVWISNNLPYIVPLENGHSQQAPAGMVALSIAETQLEIDTITGVPQ